MPYKDKNDLIEYKKQYYLDNKELINEQRKIKMICECGCEILKRDFYKHKLTKKHLDIINNVVKPIITNCITCNNKLTDEDINSKQHKKKSLCCACHCKDRMMKGCIRIICECGLDIRKDKKSLHLKQSILHYKNLNIPLPINHQYYTPIETNKE
jgi:hypothetical protein